MPQPLPRLPAAGNLPIYEGTDKQLAYSYCMGNIQWLMVGVEVCR